jgi:hypothetical protein
MLIIILIVLNIPVFLLIGWVVFDSGAQAADTFWEGLVHLLKVLFVPRIVRVFMGEEEEGLSMLAIAGYFIACGAAVFAEYRAIVWMFPALAIEA